MRNHPEGYLSALEEHFAPPLATPNAGAGADGARSPSSAPLTTNQAAACTAFQRWFHFKEAFAPSFVAGALKTLAAPARHVIDPFGGSGTTAITCQLLGVDATTIEVNPFLADVILAKTTRVAPQSLTNAAVTFKRSLAQTQPDLSVFDHVPSTFVEDDAKERWIFSASVAERLTQYVKCIGRVPDADIRRFFTVALGAVLVDCSNVYVNGKGRRYRGGWRDAQATGSDVDQRFASQLTRIYEDVQRFQHRPLSSVKVIHGDSRAEMGRLKEAADLIVFSPPYPNSFDYTDIYNVELWALGYLRSYEENGQLRRSTLHSHVQIGRAVRRPTHASATLAKAVARLEEKRSGLWHAKIPEMIQGYFADLETIMQESRRLLSDTGKVLMVVGDSRYANVLIDVPQILAELAQAIGFGRVDFIEVRKMRASAQQGGIHQLRECIVELAR